MMGGVYHLPDTINMGKREGYLTIRNYMEDSVTVSGGVPLDIAWEREGSQLTGRYPGSCSEVYYGSYRLYPARSPNTEGGVNTNIAREPYHKVTDLLLETETCKKDGNRFKQDCPDVNKNGFFFDDELAANWTYIDQTEILVYHSWIAEYAKVGSVQTVNGKKKVLFKEPLTHAPVGQWIKSGDLRFVVLNNLAVLDKPGEYVCVEDGGEAIISFIAPSDAPSDIPIMSKLETLITIAATNVTIQGIQFKHSAYYGKDGYNFGNAALKVFNSERINIKDCHFSQTAMTGLSVANSDDVRINENMFTDIGYHGLLVTDRRPTRNVEVFNNYFDGCGTTRFWEPSCMFITADNIKVVNNEITNTANGGIFVKSLPHSVNHWGDQGVTHPANGGFLHHIEFNHIHHFGQGILSDFGAVKTGISSVNCDGVSFATLQDKCHAYIHVYNNLLHDGKAYHSGANFLYSDVSASRNTFENNIMYGSGSMALVHHCGVDNVSKNNIVHRTRTAVEEHEYPIEIVWSGCEKEGGKYQNYSNYHNIYLMDNTTALSFYRNHHKFDKESSHFYQNLFWAPSLADKEVKMFPYDLDWYQWKDTGIDTDSVWADPGFQDPSSGQYVLGESSPALDLGIKQIQLDNFGIQSNVQLFYKNK